MTGCAGVWVCLGKSPTCNRSATRRANLTVTLGGLGTTGVTGAAVVAAAVVEVVVLGSPVVVLPGVLAPVNRRMRGGERGWGEGGRGGGKRGKRDGGRERGKGMVRMVRMLLIGCANGKH